MARTLEQIAALAKSHKVSPDERRAQRVSLIMGVRSKSSALSREKIADLLDQTEGHPAASRDKTAA
jgi:hypothetical protein